MTYSSASVIEQAASSWLSALQDNMQKECKFPIKLKLYYFYVFEA